MYPIKSDIAFKAYGMIHIFSNIASMSLNLSLEVGTAKKKMPLRDIDYTASWKILSIFSAEKACFSQATCLLLTHSGLPVLFKWTHGKAGMSHCVCAGTPKWTGC